MTSSSDHLTIFILKILSKVHFLLKIYCYFKKFQLLPLDFLLLNLTIYKNIYSINSLTSPLRVLNSKNSNLHPPFNFLLGIKKFTKISNIDKAFQLVSILI